MKGIRSEAWRDVVGDVKGFYASHPFLVLIGGAVFGSALASRPRFPEKKLGFLGLLKMASEWIGPAVRVVGRTRRVEDNLN